jgi:hypothetical protein
MCIGLCIVVINEEEEPTRCCLVFYYTYDRLNMLWAPQCPSSGAHDYTADYHMGSLILGLLKVGGLVQAGWLDKCPSGPCGNQRYSRELLMMGIVLHETC